MEYVLVLLDDELVQFHILLLEFLPVDTSDRTLDHNLLGHKQFLEHGFQLKLVLYKDHDPSEHLSWLLRFVLLN